MLQTFESVDFAWDKQPSDSVLPDGQIKEFLTLTIAFRGGMWVRFKKGERD
ncbi:hypothetical protein BT69DRAFT_600141 [Atractiella rhizophila]|nr:hypothetical protein BT69DRAFT_600141 [Atractiella rhizophila]